MPSLQKSGGLKFDGNSYISIPMVLPNEGSMQFKYKPYPAWYNYNELIDNSVDPNAWELWIYNTGQIGARFGSPSSAVTVYQLPNPSQIYDICISWSKANLIQSLYVDGVLRATGSIIWQDPTSPFYLGGGNPLNTKAMGTNYGTRLYNRVLSPSEVYNNYQGNVVRNGLAGEWLLGQTSGLYAVDSSQGASSVGKNLLPDFNSNRWQSDIFYGAPSGFAVDLINPYKATLTLSSPSQAKYIQIPVTLGKTYTISWGTSDPNLALRIYKGAVTTGNGNGFFMGSESGIPNSFTVDSSYSGYITIRITSFNNSGTSVANNIQLEEGSLATVFQPMSPGNHGILFGGQWLNKAAKQKTKKNILPDFDDVGWNISGVGGAAVVRNKTSFTLNATANSQYMQYKVAVKPNTVYTMSCSHNGRIAVYDQNVLTAIAPYVPDQSIVFNTGNNSAVMLILGNNASGAGTYTFTNPQLEQGSTATAFEPYQLVPDLTSVSINACSKNAVATASSLESSNFDASKAIDGDGATRWSSVIADPQWVQVYFGVPYAINGYSIRWETASARDYKIQYSDDGVNWSDAYSFTGGNSVSPPSYRIDKVSFPTAVGRYWRVYCISRASQFGYSIWDLQLFGYPAAPTKRAVKFDQRDYTFSRPSVEPYNGMTVPMDTPRVDGNGVIVEEGTVNLLTNPRMLNNCLNWLPYGTSMSASSKDGYTVLTKGGGVGTTTDGYYQNANIVPSTNYVLKYRIKHKSGDNTIGSHLAGLVPTNIKLDGVIVPIVNNTVTIPSDGNFHIVEVFITTQSTITDQRFFIQPNRGGSLASEFYLDYSQLEAKAYATTFTDNPLGRQAEFLTFPTANVLNASAGTIEVWAYEDGSTGRQGYLIDSSQTVPSRFLFVKQAGGIYEIYTNGSFRVNLNMLSKGFHLYCLRWGGSTLDVFIDGLKTNGNIAIPSMVFDSGLSLGVRYLSSVNQWNAPIKSLRISNVALSDQEILDRYNRSKNNNMVMKFHDDTTKLINF